MSLHKVIWTGVDLNEKENITTTANNTLLENFSSSARCQFGLVVKQSNLRFTIQTFFHVCAFIFILFHQLLEMVSQE